MQGLPTTYEVVHIVAYLVRRRGSVRDYDRWIRLFLHNIGSGMCRVCDAHSVAEPLACVIVSCTWEIVSPQVQSVGLVSYNLIGL